VTVISLGEFDGVALKLAPEGAEGASLRPARRQRVVTRIERVTVSSEREVNRDVSRSD
jgi:hypothetical protein